MTGYIVPLRPPTPPRAHPLPPPPPLPRAVEGVLRIALSQLDARKRDLNDSASWIISDFFDKVTAWGLTEFLLGSSGSESWLWTSASTAAAAHASPHKP